MNINKSVISTLVFILLYSVSIYGQRNYSEEADKAFRLKQYYDAIDQYKKAYVKVKGNRAEKNRILFQIAECYRFTNDTRRSETQYKRLVRMKYQKNNPLVLLYYADALRANLKYEEALANYNLYKDMAPDDPRGAAGAESCIKAQHWIDNPTRYEVENVKKLNSRENDWAPTFYDKKKYKKLVFTSSRESSTGKIDVWTGQNFSDLYITSKDRKGSWSTPIFLEEEGTINTFTNEGEAHFNERASTMYFTRCLFIKKEKLPCQIYTAKKKGRGWSDAELISLRADSFDVVHPSLSDNELTIIFASNMPGGYGGLDLYMATRKRKTRAFDKPVNLGPKINTPAHEAFPFYRYDSAFYFASNGHIGIGGFDIYKVIKEGNDWSDPVNMKAPVNSPGDDLGITFIDKKEEGYLSSNRKGGRGGDDIYYFILPPLLYTLSGVVRDDSTLQFIPGATVKLVGSDGSSIIAKTDPRGFYKFDNTQIMVKTSYDLDVSKQGYFDTKGKETTVGLTESKDLVHDFNLVPLPVEPVLLPEIRYDLAKWELLPQYQDSLIELIQTLQDNPRLVIELQSHTDVRPIPMTNDTLSQRRAQSVVNYLRDRGIHPERLRAKGYAARDPRKLSRSYTYPASDPKYAGISFPAGVFLTESYIKSLPTVREREAAHQLNRRTTFIIISDDFVPPATNDTITGGLVKIIQDPDANMIPYVLGPGAVPMSNCVVNGITMNFVIDKNIDFINFSWNEAMKFLKEGRITKSDFVLGDKAIANNGDIIENAVLVLDKLTVGDDIQNSIEVTVVKGLKDYQMVFGESIIQEIYGELTIDKENKELIFR
ncbi:OmpA family protein [candidate division KSB1 bacterium]